MKNIIKLALVMLCSVSISFSVANSGELSVSGAAVASYVVTSSDSATGVEGSGPGLGVSNEFTLSASGELDNGYTWKWFADIDGDTTQDDGGMSMTTPYGSLAINISDGGLELSKAAAMTATGDRGSDSAYGEDMLEEWSIGDMKNVQYHTPADLLPYGIAVKVAYAPTTSAGGNSSKNATGGADAGGFTAANASGAIGQTSNMGSSMTSYQVKAAPIDGLAIGASYSEYDTDLSAAQKPEAGSIYAKYATGAFTVAAGATRIAVATAATAATYETVKNTKLGASFAVNDDLTIAYSEEDSEASIMTPGSTDVEMTVKQVSAAYTMGGMTLAVSQNSYDNVSYTLNKDAKSYVFNVSMAF